MSRPENVLSETPQEVVNQLPHSKKQLQKHVLSMKCNCIATRTINPCLKTTTKAKAELSRQNTYPTVPLIGLGK